MRSDREPLDADLAAMSREQLVEEVRKRVAAPAMGWGRDRLLWVGVGGFLALMTLLLPWWFWENWKARGLRNAIGDGEMAMVYLALAAVMVWVGLFTDWTFGRR